jgi:beta-glucosidase
MAIDYTRRGVLAGGAGIMAASAAGAARRRDDGRFPAGFRWGASTSAPQIEGAWDKDGRGPSIWDHFVHNGAPIKDGSNADIACDSYHRYEEDVALLRRLNLKSYRFSIAWPRIQADGRGKANVKGLDYYKRVADACHRAGIVPTATLYHWDLPQSLEEAGGWPVRDTALRFRDYAEIVGTALKDHIGRWGIYEEPKTFTQCGYWYGIFAPGRKDPLAYLKSTHVVNLGQGMAFRALKSIDPAFKISSDFDVSPMLPKTPSPADAAAAKRWFDFLNLWHLLPALTGDYPKGVLDPARQHELLGWQPGDDVLVRAPFDFIALNYYGTYTVRDAPEGNEIPGLNTVAEYGTGPHEKTEGGLDIDPPRFYDLLMQMKPVTGAIPLEIGEIGESVSVGPDASGVVRDQHRIDYLRAHFREMLRAIRDGVPVTGCHVWSLLDNFEWLLGYTSRYGLVYVDFERDRQRIIKQSGHWYAEVARTNRVT